jgi:antitoxin PrlF
MKTAIEAESALTDRYQTTVPTPVRRALKLGKRDRIHYCIQSDGSVLMSRAEEVGLDPALQPFLGLLSADLQAHPERIRALSPNLIARVQQLVEGVEFDMNTPLSADDE